MYFKIILLISFLIFGCAKKRPYDFIANKETVPKKIFQTQAQEPFLSTLSYGQASRSSTVGLPYFMGPTKAVTYEIGEHELVVKELEGNPKFLGNPTNNKTILSIPIRHVDYACEKDAYGECRNKEIEDEKTPWQSRHYIELDYDKAQFFGIEELPIEMTNLISKCYQMNAQKAIGHELTVDAFNFEIQRSYSLDLSNKDCWSQIPDLENPFQNLTFDIRYVYSIVRSHVLTSSDYQPALYPQGSQDVFGFFKSTLEKLDSDNNHLEDHDIDYLNRWNPNKKIITYYLSDEFYKPENDYIMAATQRAIENINRGLLSAHSGIQILLKESHYKKIGDLRSNMIVLVEDPLKNKIIGYGPIAANPLTGEIVNARVVMYLGTIKKIVQDTYEDIRAEKSSQNVTPLTTENVSSIKNLGNIKFLWPQSGRPIRNLLLKNTSGNPFLDNKNLTAHMRDSNKGAEDLPASLEEKIRKSLSKFQRVNSGLVTSPGFKFYNKKLNALSENNAYPEELFNVEYAFHLAGFDEVSTLKPWSQLTEQEKENIIKQVLPYIWIPTLVHEMGHNLGLRHNFAGSEDQENFYSTQELQDMGIHHAVRYSSVMDYAYKETNDLPTLGKYDVAALRYGYKQEIEVDDGRQKVFVPVQGPLDKIKERRLYKYCTDENVGANPNCNRFDEGTTYSEIAAHYVSAYENDYRKFNLRNQRAQFSLFGEENYLYRIAGNFYFLRLFNELYEKVKNDFNIPDQHPAWKKNNLLKDILKASTLSGKFFLNVLLTPDVRCVLSVQDMPETAIAVVALRDLDADATTCFHPQVQSTVNQISQQMGLPLLVSGQGGKSFQSRKDSLNPNPSNNEIDVQGIWIDKLLASELLFMRELGTNVFDRVTQNYLDHVSIGPLIENVIAGILLGRGEVDLNFLNSSGEPAQYRDPQDRLVQSLPVQVEFGPEHFIQVPVIESLNKILNLPNHQTPFPRQLLENIKKLQPSLVYSAQSQKFLQAFEVYRDLPVRSDPSEFIAIRVGTQFFYAREENKLAKTAIQSLEASRIISQASQDEIKAIIERKKEGKPTPEASPDRLKKVAEQPVEVLEAYLNGVLKEPTFYEELLSFLIESSK